MRVRRLAGAVCWVSLVLGAGGCATRTVSPFIIRNGSGPIHAGNVLPPAKAHKEQLEHARREALAGRAAHKPPPLPSIEQVDRGLREALATLALRETPEAHVAVARNYWRVGIYDAAYDNYSDAIKLNPKDVDALDGRARVWRHWRMTGPALADAHRAIFYGAGRPDVLNTLGTILETAGQCTEARKAYAGALRLDPSAVWARSNLERLQCNSNTTAAPSGP